MNEQQHTEKEGTRQSVGFLIVYTTGRVLTLLILVVTIGGFFAPYHWRFDLLTHFPVQLAIGSVVPLVLLTLLRKWSFSLIAATTLVVNGMSIIPLYWPAEREIQPERTVRIVSTNVYTGNPDTDAVIKFIRDTDPDVIVFMEIDDRWQQSLGELDSDYPHTILRPRADNFGIGMMSRLPIRSFRVECLDEAMLPSIFAEAEVDGETLHIIGTHPLPPMSEQNSELRNQHLRKLAKRVDELDDPVVVVGDLNITSWSPHFRKLVKDSGLSDSRAGRGVQATWPGASPLLRIPIDHALVSEEIVVTDRYVGADVGSDHRPIVVEIGIVGK